MTILVCGTLAIDHLARYPGRFDALPPRHGLNLSMQLEDLVSELGGCAMNICYSLQLLGDEPLPFVYAGRDYRERYRAHVAALGLDSRGIVLTDAASSSQAFIFTDAAGNQLTGFYPGDWPLERLSRDLRALLTEARPSYAVLAPDRAERMLACAEVLTARGVPFLTDPGQGVTDFEAAEIDALLDISSELVVNAHEWTTLHERLGVVTDALAGRLDWVVITDGANGARCLSPGAELHVPTVPPRTRLDPTGCGDAYRAGFVHAWRRGADLRHAMRVAAVTATLALEEIGAQHHDLSGLEARYREAWGEHIAAALGR